MQEILGPCLYIFITQWLCAFQNTIIMLSSVVNGIVFWVIERLKFSFVKACSYRHLTYGTPFVAKLFSAMSGSYFKTNLVFYRIDSVFLHNQVDFFTEPTWFLFRTNSIALQNRLDSLNRTDSVFFREPTRLSCRTDSIILQNRLGFFTEPTWFFH